ncbi:cation diffusion facilitator family transporter [Vagococcus hydrophili]|uniref:Cation transporter n=1 Tax=Vagococcus hydrophili TaxID=2714947 RepID=A0A6G8AX81_9ENTE|nr:cation diffusion facilitator family transporter [Vagococcus hydrophili]QIL49711.1 cation transporter [Vagococcus hydrophili]
MMTERSAELKQAEKGALISILAYVILAAFKLGVGSYANSKALSADGLNNFTDTIASIAILIGLRLSRKPADNEHRYGHWKAENVASLLTSLIMFAVGFDVLIKALHSLINHDIQKPDPIAAVVGIISAIIMYAVYLVNKKLGEKYQSSSLIAVSKDNFSDMLTSLGASIAVITATFHLAWLDTLTAVVIALVILKTAFDIFKESTFYLSDGFDRDKLVIYKLEILKVEGIKEVPVLRARNLGANIFLDVTVRVDPDLTVKQSHQIVDDMEEDLKRKFKIFDIDVHVEPFED